MKKIKKNSVRFKQIVLFMLITVVIMGVSLGLYTETIDVVQEMTYEKMKSKGDYYQDILDNEIEHVLQNQIELLSERNLYSLLSSGFLMEPYEKREVLLSLREKLSDMTYPSIVETVELYVPKSNYKITPGAVTRMRDDEQKEMSTYLAYPEAQLNYDGSDFFYVRSMELGGDEQKPACVVVTRFSSQELEHQLNGLAVSQNSGAVYFNKKLGVLIGKEEAVDTVSKVLGKLKKDKEGNYQDVSEIELDRKNYLVFVGEQSHLGVLIQFAQEAPIMEYIRISWQNMIGFMIILFVMAIGFIWYNNKLIHRPMQILLKAFERVQEGKLDQKIHHNKEDEFAYLYQGFNDMEDRVRQLLDEVAEQTDLAQKAQLKQLQAQINPHFLYNSFFILSRRIKKQDFESAENFAKHLGNYFKYLTRDGSDDISLEQEAEHAKSYAAIQGIRFSNRISIKFGEVPEESKGFLVPRLIIQPLLENAFQYSLENKVSDGFLEVSFIKKEGSVIVCVEDNGDDITDEKIVAMQASLESQEIAQVTGLVNIHRRLKLYYKNKAGLLVDRSRLGGVAVRILLPSEEKKV